MAKTVERRLNSVTISWDNLVENSQKIVILQIFNEIKEWQTVYIGEKRHLTVPNLAPCTCYTFRIKSDTDWIQFKSATSDPPYILMHFLRAIRIGKTPLIRKIAQTRPILLDVRDKTNKMALIEAINTGDPFLVNLVINLGANCNLPFLHNQRTPLMYTIYKQNIQIASLLIDKGATILDRDINGLNILHYAVDSGNCEVIKYVLELGIDVNCQDSCGWTPLLRAVILCCGDEVEKVLLENGAEPGIKDKNGFDYYKHKQLSAAINCIK